MVACNRTLLGEERRRLASVPGRGIANIDAGKPWTDGGNNETNILNKWTNLEAVKKISDPTEYG